jgi:AcrR family transcriptional regulator
MNSRSSSETAVPSLRSRIRRATDAAILAAAEQVFAEQGLHDARMNDIARRARVAVGTLYNHFQDRDALLTELLEVRRREILQTIDHALDDGAGPFRERLTGMLRALFAYHRAHRNFFYVFMQREGGRWCAGMKAPELTQQIYERMEKLVKRGLREKALRPDAAELYPAMLMGLVHAVKLRQQVLDAGDQDVDTDALVRCFLDGAGA